MIELLRALWLAFILAVVMWVGYRVGAKLTRIQMLEECHEQAAT